MRVLVVGAGMSGLAGAARLADRGHTVTVLDKGRSPGGRLATRRIGTATLDHGAQFFTVRSDQFGQFVAPHLDSGLVREWCHGFGVDDGYPRYAVTGGMNALAKVVASPMDVRTGQMVFAIRRAPRDTALRWAVVVDDGTVLSADALIVTCPLPQSYSLLVTAEVELPTELIRTDYDRTIALLLTLDRPSAMHAPGGLQRPNEQLSFVCDNRLKGISATDALTVHASAAWSEARWEDPPDALEAALTDEAAGFIGAATVTAAQVKKWRFATPRTLWPEPCWTSPDGTLALAGDAFAGPRIEGAVMSGIAAADALLS